MAKKLRLIKSVPTIREVSDPIVTQLDILKLPIFVADSASALTNAVNSTEGVSLVAGKPRVKVSVPGKLGAAEHDVFHAILNEAKKQNFKSPDIVFTARSLLKEMNWPETGWYYQRLAEALSNLQEIKIEIIWDDEEWHSYRFFHDFRIRKRSKRKKKGKDNLIEIGPSGVVSDIDPTMLDESFVTLGKTLLSLCTENRMKALHPYFFTLRSMVAKRLYGLISALASDRDAWVIELKELADRIPLKGVKYSTPSGIKQAISPALKRLEKDNIIRGYSFQILPESNEAAVRIEINQDYVYPKDYLLVSQRKALSDPTDPDSPAFRALVEKGIKAKTARALVDEYGERPVMAQVEHLDYVLKEGKAIKNKQAWLKKAIQEDFSVPEDFTMQAQAQREKKQKSLIYAAKSLIDQKRYVEAIQKAQLCIDSGSKGEASLYVEAALKIQQDAKQAIEHDQQQEKVNHWLSGLSNEEMEALHVATERKIREVYQGASGEIMLSAGRKGPMYAAELHTMALEAMGQKKQLKIDF